MNETKLCNFQQEKHSIFNLVFQAYLECINNLLILAYEPSYTVFFSIKLLAI